MGNDNSKTFGNFDVDKKKCLGQGGFGKVYRGIDKRNKKPVAIKQCSVSSEQVKGAFALEEIKTLQHISNHKHIVSLLDYFFRNDCFWIVMEFCDLGDLEKYMRKYRPLLIDILKLTHQAASALNFLHTSEPKIVHRDVKPANILVKTENKCHVLKLADFGVSKKLLEAEGTAMLQTVVGTEVFMAPEIFEGKAYTESVDIFALGLVCLAMLTFKPVDDKLLPCSVTSLRDSQLRSIGKQMYESKLKRLESPPVTHEYVSDSEPTKKLKKLVLSMTSREVTSRPSAQEVCQAVQEISHPEADASDDCSDIEIDEEFASSSGESSEEEEEEKKPQRRSRELDYEKLLQQSSDGFAQMMAKYLEGHSSRRREKRENSSDDGKLRIGHRVLVNEDTKVVEELQEDHGGYNQEMASYCGEPGYIRHISSGKVQLAFTNGKRFWYNEKLLTRIKDDDPMVTSQFPNLKFKYLDFVRISQKLSLDKLERLQERRCKWREKIEQVIGIPGIVDRVDRDGDCQVTFLHRKSSMTMLLAHEMLEAVDNSGQEIEDDDIVVIHINRDEAKRLQEGFGGWNTLMEKSLGKIGKVVRIRQSGVTTVRMLNDHNDRTFSWNVKSLRLFMKAEGTAGLYS